MRRRVRLGSSLAGQANMAAASPGRNGNDHVHSTAKAWTAREWPSERSPAKA